MDAITKTLSRPSTHYLLALLPLALAAVASHAVLIQSLSELDQDSVAINTSGRQRMLSEQTFRLSGELVTYKSDTEAQTLRNQLMASLSLMRESHKRLAADVEDLGITSPRDIALKEAYFDGASPLDEKLSVYFASLQSLIAAPSEGLTLDQDAYQSVVQTHRAGLLNDLDQVVQIYEAKARENLEASERLHVYLTLAMLSLLLLEALFVFRPLIRRQVQANNELLAARDKAQSELDARTSILAAVSHEIRTPLGGILGIIDQLKRERSPVERERAFHLVEDSCEALLDTLDAILQQSRLGQGAEDLSDKIFRPASVANRVAELFRPVARRKALRIDVNASTDREARGDDARIQQVLANLVSNSVKFTQSGAITIFVQEPDDGTPEWAFVVADTGAGMDERRVEGLFKPFGHSSDDTLGRSVGAGLGLSITRDLVESMGGRIEVESEPGKGSAFTIYIPLAEPPETTEEISRNSQSAYAALLIDRASDRVQAEAVAVQCGFTVVDLSVNADPDLPGGCDVTLIADAALLCEVREGLVKSSARIILLGEYQPAEAEPEQAKTTLVSHTQLARSLSELLKEQGS